MSGRRKDQNAGERFCLARDLVVDEPRRVNQFWQRVVVASGGCKLAVLDDDRAPWQQGVPATVVEVEVAIDDQLHMIQGQPSGSEGDGQWDTSGAVMRVHERMLTHSGVEK